MSMRRVRRWPIAGILALVLAPVLAIFFNAPIAQAGPSDPVARVSLAVPSTALIGSSVAFDVSFDNPGPVTGYGPYVDLALPRGHDLVDGLTFVSATYLGASVTATQLIADGSGNVTHPYAVDDTGAPLVIHGLAAGQAYVVLRLPFGSFTPGQPQAVIHVTTQMSDGANVGWPLTVTADGGFQFGRTPINDPVTDPSTLGASTSKDVTPSIILVTKHYDGPEQETATGPNFPESYTITATVASGQRVDDLTLTDTLPDNMQYLSTDATAPGSVALSTPAAGTPGGVISLDFGTVTGKGGGDAKFTFHFYIPRLDASSAEVLPSATGAFAHSFDTASASANWSPLDPNDWDGINPIPVSATSGPPPDDLTDKSVAIQKTPRLAVDLGALGASPGDTVEWTMKVEVSDFFALQNVVVYDRLGDGTLWDGTAPTLSVSGNGFTSAAAPIDAANYTVSPTEAGGVTPFQFSISDELMTRGQSTGRMVGGCIDPITGTATPDCAPGYDDGPTTATIVFQSIIQQTYISPGQGEVVEGDTLTNLASVTGDVVSTTAPFDPTGSSIGDGTTAVAAPGTGASVTIKRGVLEKSIYAINGVAPLPGPVHISPGDSITYELKQGFPTTRTDGFRMIDYLPLPIFDATTVTTFDPTFDADWIAHPTNDAAPVAGTAKYGPSDTFHAMNSFDSGPAPTPTVPAATPASTAANSIEFHYGNYALYPPAASVADILFTVTVSDQPFADGLLFTNQARSETKNAAGALQTADAIIQIVLDQPVLTMTKGVVATSHASAVFAPMKTGPVDFSVPPDSTCPAWTGGPITSSGLAANPIDSDLDGADAGDLVRFAITVENTGHADAFMVHLADTQPAGFVVPGSGLNLCATNGAGDPIGTVDLGGGLFGTGIQLVDGSNGSVVRGIAGSTPNTTGSNIAVITYTLQVAGTALPDTTMTNTASLIDYTDGFDAGGHLGAPLTDDATVHTSLPSATKEIAGTSLATTTPPAVTIGEIVSYRVTLTIPEGVTAGATVTDNLPAGMALVGCTSIRALSGGDPTADLTTSLAGGFSDACAPGTDPVVTGNGQDIVFNLGDIDNANRDDTKPETLEINYDAVVLNVATNMRGHSMTNGATLTWADGGIAEVYSNPIVVAEPWIDVTKTPSNATADAGDTITYGVTVTNTADPNGSDAYKAEWSDTIPGGMDHSATTPVYDSGTVPTTLTISGADITATWDDLPAGASTTFHYTVVVDADAVPDHVFHNTENVAWNSLPGDATPVLSTFNPYSTRRTGVTSDPGFPTGAVNNYRNTAAADVQVPAAGMAKTIVGTSAAGTQGYAIGEIVTYLVTVTIPEGKLPAATITDNLPAGMALVDCLSIDAQSDGLPTSDLTTSLAGGFGDACVAGTDPTATASGRLVTFNLGDVTNANRVDAKVEKLLIEYRAVVLNVVGGGQNNVRGHILANTATLNWTGAVASVSSTAPNVHVVEPSMFVTKNVNKATGDAGDEFLFTIVITNPVDPNGSKGFEATWTDTLPTGLTYETGLAASSCDVAPTTLTAVGNDLTAIWPIFDQGDSCTIKYKATLDANVPAGAQYLNTGYIAWTSLTGDHITVPGSSFNAALSTERTGDTADPGLAANTYKQSGGATVTVTELAPVKSVVTTSEAGTTGTTDLAIGEIVRYRVATVIPEGQTRNVSITDALAPGLEYLNDGTTKVAFVTNDAGMTSSTLSDPSLAVSGNEFSTDHPVFVLPAGSISGGSGGAGNLDGFQSGDTPKFDFGDLTNLDRDPDSELVVIEFNVLVNNILGNQNGTPLTDQASLWTGATQTKLIDSNQLTQTVAEPAMTMAKTITTHPVDAGDAIVYKIVATNAGGATAPAYDYNVTDTLPAAVVAPPSAISVVCTSGTYSNSSGAALVDVTFTQIDPGENCQITITTTVAATEPAGEIFVNPANAVFSSLPGATGTPNGQPGNATGSANPGGPGDATGERTGSGGLGTLNDYVNTDQVSQTLAVPSIVKNASSLAKAPIGAETTFDIVVTLPEGTTRGLAVTDTLPVGLDPVSYAVVKTGGRLGKTFSGTLADPTPTAIPTDSTHRLWTLTFGDTLVPVNGVTGDEQFEVQITARVANIGANQSGSTLVNAANVTYTNPGTGNPVDIGAASPPPVVVYEPDLTLTKGASNPAPYFNATETYTITISHRGTTYDIDAHDLTIADTLPVATGWTYAGSLDRTLCPDADSASVSGGVMTAVLGTFPVADSCTITYQATINDQPAAHLKDSFINNVAATWSSLAGPSTFERDGSGGFNDYNATAASTVTVSGVDLALAKTDGVTSATAAAILKYVNSYQNKGNLTAGGVVLTETVPADTTFNLANSTGTWLAAVSGNCANGAAAGTVCHINVGSVAAAGAGNFTFAVTVIDPIAANRTQISNTATIADDHSHGVDATPADNIATDVDLIPQADLSLTKTVDVSRPVAGQSVTYTITLTNSGPDDATSVKVTDHVPAGLTFVSSVPGAGNTYVSGTGIWTIAGTVAHGTSKVLTITATAATSADATNIAEVTHSADGDPDSKPNNGVTTEDDYATALTHPLIADMGIAKTVSNSTPNVGTDVTFTITATNYGPDDAPNAKVTDVLPAGLTYVSSTPSVGSWAGNTWTIGTLNNGASATLSLVAHVATAGSKVNTATVSADPFDNGPHGNSASASVSQLLDLAVSKSVDNTAANVGTNVTFTVGVSNTGTNAATGVVIHDPLPGGLTWVSDDAAGAYNRVSGDWTLGTMAANTSATLHVVATVSTAGAKLNTATVGHVNETQTSLGNDSASATVTPPQADLAVTKVVDNTSPEIGNTVKWTVTVHNIGGSAATNVTLTDVLQAGLSWVSDDSSGAYDHGTGVWSVGSLGVGTTATLNINSTVTSGGAKSNTAAIGHSDQYDPVSGNNSATATLTTKLADIGVAKTVDNATPNVGATIHYSLTVTNHGPETATSLVATDLLPAGVSLVSASPSKGSYVAGSGAWSIGTLALNASATMTITATVTASGHIVNTLSFTSMLQTDSNGANDSATAPIDVPPAADIAVTKTVDNNRPNVGGNATFTITATNHGPDNATGVTIADAVPAGLTFVSATPAAGTSYAGGTWTIGNLANGASKTLSIVATVSTAGLKTNTASVSHSDQFDTNAANNSASASVDQRINLVVAKTASPLTPNVGTNTTFTIGVSNAGPNTANNVVINDLLPAGLTWVSDDAAGAYNHTTGVWTIGSINSGGSAALHLVATVTVPGRTDNTASVGHVDETQTSTLDDSATASVTTPEADLDVTKTVDNAKPDVGDEVVYTVAITNIGPDDATGVVIHDPLPAGMTWVSDDGAGSYDHTTTNDWTVGELAVGDTATLRVHATVDAFGDYTNTATVSHSDQYDPVAANNHDDVFLTTRKADIGVTKTVDHATPNVGDTVRYTVTATNNGGDPATLVVIHDALPAGVTYVSDDGAGKYNSTTGDWAVGSLAVDASATLHVDARVVGSGTINNTTTVKSLRQKDEVPGNDSATVGIDVPPAADLSLAKTVDDNTPDKGSNVVFTLTLTNAGPDRATGVVVHDALPAGMTYVSDDGSGAYDSTTGDWTVGGLNSGAHTALRLTASVDVESQLTNTAEVSRSDLYDPDSTPGNGNASEDDLAVATLNAHGVADLSVAKKANPARVVKGKQTTYTIVVTNNGPDDATHVILRDQLPVGLTYVSDSGSYDKTTGAWTVGSLANGHSATLTIVAQVGQTGSITNTVTVVSSDQRDPTSSNDSATAGVAAAGPTPPVTTSGNKPAPPPQDSGPLVLWLLAAAFGAVSLTASGALRIRNRRLKMRR